jgi:hypothetical protein
MKKIAFTLYMIGLISIVPLYTILELRKASENLPAVAPFSAANEKVKTTTSEKTGLSKPVYVLKTNN